MGTRIYVNYYQRLREDHPHAYGDKVLRSDTATDERGSSPRVWGQVIFGIRKNRFMRIIPTRMGTSIVLCQIRYRQKDHPHAYGDKCLVNFVELELIGSSPRVWGQAVTTVPSSIAIRIIPTRMGTSTKK